MPILLRRLSIHTALASAVALLSVGGCDPDANIATEDAGGGSHDAGPGADGCVPLECAAPPMGCHYEGSDPCVTCGTVVCDDGGVADAGCATPIECAAPPMGCHYEGGDLCTTCGTLVCDEVVCGVGTAETFPDFDRTCADVSDCAVYEHQSDCCGSLRALGLRADVADAFAAAEASCRGMYPGCGCAPRPTEADDGTTDTGARAARVECVMGLCTSTFGLPNGADCDGTGDVCGAGLACCYPCGIAGCTNQCMPRCEDGTPGCAGGCMLFP
ncbi:MAG: hypothetical protein AB7S26_17090 [Sandaracinaceae bacterium]